MNTMVTIEMKLAVAAVMLSASCAYGEPFGLEVKNFTPEKYGCQYNYEDHYFCDAPRKHPLLVAYAVSYIENIGLCEIRAFSDFKDQNAEGTEVRELTDRLYNQIREKYGFAELYDTYSDAWFKKDFMEGFREKNYIYGYFAPDISPVDNVYGYIVSVDAAPLDAGIEKPELKARTILYFKTEHYEACRKDVESRGQEAF